MKKGSEMKTTALTVVLVLVSSFAHAGWLDDISTAVGGHISDFKSRFADDQLIDGDIVAQTTFRENDRGQDALHHGSGTVMVIDAHEGRFIQLAPDFSSTPGPDYHVYISQDSNVDHEDRFDKSSQVELGRLVKGSGASFYKIPENTEFQSVTVWCKAFNEFIVSADFESAVAYE
jgi:hypothetical protein